MNKQGLLILDRKGEYIENTQDQRGRTVYGLQNHPMARERMVVVSQRQVPFKGFADRGEIHAYLRPQFNISDLAPTDLADFLRSLTPTQADLIRDYSYLDDFYQKVLAETRFRQIDKRNWYQDFPGLISYTDKGKALLKKFERDAEEANRYDLTEKERDELDNVGGAGGSKVLVLENAIRAIKRFCIAPFFGGTTSGPAIMNAPSCVEDVLRHLSEGQCVFVDMRGLQDDEYTMIAALFARRLLTENKRRPDSKQIRACIVMEEAQNILREEDLYKGGGKGSVFIELAREGRSFKLGFVLVTQQPDARSIAPEVAKTIDTVVAFNMPPDDAKNLPRLKSAFSGLEMQVANMDIFQGVAVGNGGAVFFEAGPVNPRYMEDCANHTSRFAVGATQDDNLDSTLNTVESDEDENTPQHEAERPEIEQSMPISERLQKLSKQRQATIQKVALSTLQAWRSESNTASLPEDR